MKSNDLFEIEPQSEQTNVATDATVEIDEKKLRIKRLRDGIEELTLEDFGGDSKAHYRYIKLIEDHIKNARRAFDDDDFVEEQKKILLKSLHKSTSPFAMYIPTIRKTGVRRKRRPKPAGIPELDKLNEMIKEVEEKFANWLNSLPEYAKINEYIKSLGIDENSEYTKGEGEKAVKVKVLEEYQGFQPYWRYVGAVKNWIKENFKPKAQEEEE